jgi:16S rRNA A1518/A1519 N6-dimethyltransferase RsmA/KsgA/DIM1 with predicted DNA glycosylase/AP lyase activity
MYGSDQNSQSIHSVKTKKTGKKIKSTSRKTVAMGTIVEIGSGIGTITELFKTRINQNSSNFKLLCYETNK